MKIEQRIGRVDRIGQAHVVRAQNFALEDTVELRVREVLEQKLERILEESGVDKLADVLDSEVSESRAALDGDGVGAEGGRRVRLHGVCRVQQRSALGRARPGGARQREADSRRRISRRVGSIRTAAGARSADLGVRSGHCGAFGSRGVVGGVGFVALRAVSRVLRMSAVRGFGRFGLCAEWSRRA